MKRDRTGDQAIELCNEDSTAQDAFLAELADSDVECDSVSVSEQNFEVDSYENLAELSDSSEEEEGPLLRIGNVPREWYDDLEHWGYNIDGVAISKKPKENKLRKLLSEREDPKTIRTVYDADNDRYVELSKEEIEMIKNIRAGTYPHTNFNPEDYHYDAPRQLHPFGNSYCPPKAAFVPSKWENQKLLRMIKAVRNGWIKLDGKDKAESIAKPYLLWEGPGEQKRSGPPVIRAPKVKLPGHAESYNPPEEYLMNAEELKTWQEMDEEDRPLNFIPRKYIALRKVPGYDAFLQERFDRCLDLYLCPRATKDKIDIDPESLIPKLPNPEDLRPFPSMLVQEYLGHEGHVRSISPSPCGQWLASGGIDATIRIWEVSSGRCMKVFRGSGPVSIVQWNPKKPLIAVAYEESIELVPVALGGVDESESLSCVSGSISAFANASCVWSRHEDGKRLVISLKNIVRNLKWHPKGDYFASCLTDAISNAVMVHKLSTKSSQCPFGKSKGHVQDISFHPSKPHFFVASKRNVRVYDLLAQKLLHKMNLPMQWVSRIDLHPDGNHLLLGSFDRRVCWYDLDMTSKPYKTLKYHSRAVRSVSYHTSYPLFLSGSDDGTLHIFHAAISEDLMQDPVIVPVKILRAHQTAEDGFGALDACFHPVQPWAFSAGADGVIKLFS